MLIKLFDNFVIKIIGNPGKKLLTSMFLEYYDAKVLEELKNTEAFKPSLVIFIGKDVKNEIQKYDNVPFLIAILSKKDYDYVSSFCKEHNLRIYISPTKKIFSYYKHLNLPIFEYIHLSLAVSASALRRKIHSSDELLSSAKEDLSSAVVSAKESLSSVVNIDKELLSIDPHKPFHIRSSQIKKDSFTINFVWEPGTTLLGNKMIMEWIRNQTLGTQSRTGGLWVDTESGAPEVPRALFPEGPSLDFFTIIDIDEIYETKDMKEYLLPFTTLGIYQKGILIVNSDLEFEESQDNKVVLESKSEDFEPFDYHIYTNMMELWNNKHFIPKRLSLLENMGESFGMKDKDSGLKSSFDPQYELSIKKPPIFILDNFESICNFVSKICKNSMILYIGKEKNYKKMINS